MPHSGRSHSGRAIVSTRREPAIPKATKRTRRLRQQAAFAAWWLVATPVAIAGLEVVAEVRRLGVRFVMLVEALDRAELLQRIAILRAVRDLSGADDVGQRRDGQWRPSTSTIVASTIRCS
jgi:hypothetical protein